MIPTNSMYLAHLKTTWRRTLGVIAGVALISATVVSSFLGWRMFPSLVVYQLIASTCVGFLFWLARPFIRSYGDRLKPWPRWCFRILSWAIVLNVGVLVGLALLSTIGALPWKLYGQMFWMGFLPSTAIGVICSVGFTMYETLKFKSQYETMQARLSSLESRLRPHFLFNTLNSILALIPEDPAAAELMTVNLSALLRYSLDSTHESTVRLERELKVLIDYLEIEKMRFGSRLQYSVDVPQHLMGAEVPPFCLQTLVENSVKYGGDNIRVSARNGGSRLILSVWDSGPGFAGAENVVMPGHGLDNLRGRLAALWGTDAALHFPQNGEGTTVQISLPVKLRE
jgi:hypothetical protein